MTWNASPFATNYKIQISTVANFLVITDSATVSNTQYNVPVGECQRDIHISGELMPQTVYQQVTGPVYGVFQRR